MLSCLAPRPCDHTSAPGAYDPHLIPDHPASSPSYSPYSHTYSSMSSHAWHSVPPPSYSPNLPPTIPPPIPSTLNRNDSGNLPLTGGGYTRTGSGGGRQGFNLGIGTFMGLGRTNASGAQGEGVECGSGAAYLYFVSFIFLCSFLVIHVGGWCMFEMFLPSMFKYSPDTTPICYGFLPFSSNHFCVSSVVFNERPVCRANFSDFFVCW